ncbi:MAG: TPM domain-containing protein, partial [Candidatus Desantisbacteria bacterium]
MRYKVRAQIAEHRAQIRKNSLCSMFYILSSVFCILYSVSCLADVVSFPEPNGYVTDSAEIISPNDELAITGMAEELERKTTAQLAVVTIETTQPETIEGFSVKLFEKWGIGQKGKDNGILLLIASSDRKLRIETGYAVEGILPDATCKMIIENGIIPYFKRAEYSQGILYGASVIATDVAKGYNVEISGSSKGIP